MAVITAVSFSQQFTLNGSQNIFTMVDLTDYAGSGVPLTGVKGCFTITAPSGTIIYANTTFANPGSDIIRNLSATNQITIPLPNLSNQSPETGIYTVVYRVQITDGVLPVYYVSDTNTYTFTYVAPTVSITAAVDCLSPLITGTDGTDYIVDGITPTNSRTMVLQFPDGSGATSITNTTSATITTSTFYTGPTNFTVTSILTYVFSDGLIVVDTVTGTKSLTVDCSMICNLYCCLKALNAQKNNARAINGPFSPQFLALENQLEQIAVVLALLKMAIECGKQNDANTYLTNIQELANCADDCSCNDGTPNLVRGLGLQNVNVVVQSGGAPISVTSAVAGGVTTYTVTLSSAFVTKVNSSYNTVLVASTGISIIDSGVVNDVRTYTISSTVTAQNRLDFLCRLQFSNFAVPIVTITNSAYLYSGSNIIGTAAVTATDIANPAWATMNNLFTCTTFQTSANNNYKVDCSVTVQGADFTLAGGFGTWTAAQMKSLSDQLQVQILDKSSGSFKFRLVVGADTGVGLPLSNKFMVVYPDIYVMISISE